MGSLGGNGPGETVLDASRAGEIRAYLRLLLAAPLFAASPRRSKLLSYLCEQTLLGKGDSITEYALGLDVFDKPTSFDPRIESIVRSEVTRLRQRLNQHYQTDGKFDSIVVELPLRSYAPLFTLRVVTAEPLGGSIKAPDPHGIAPPPVPKRRFWVPAVALLALALLILSGVRFLKPPVFEPPPLSLAILPVDIEPSAADLRDSSSRITEILSGVVQGARGVTVLDWRSVPKSQGGDSWREARTKLPAALFLNTVVGRHRGGLDGRMTLRLRDGRVAWSGVFPIKLESMTDLTAAFSAFGASSILPVLERESNYLAFARSAASTAGSPPIAGLRDPGNPCNRAPSLAAGLSSEQARLELIEGVYYARSYDSRIPFRIGPAAFPVQTHLAVKGATPLRLQAPALYQLDADTCVLLSYGGTVPVYRSSCVVPAAGDSKFVLNYTCSPKAYPIDIARLVNNGDLYNPELAPAGTLMLAGVPFMIPDGNDRYWRGTVAAENGARPVSLVIPVNRTSVSTAYFLLNTEWGQPGPPSYLTLIFDAGPDVHFEKRLLGGVDVRDYHDGVYTNTVNATTTRQVFDDGGGQRIDMIEVALPSQFRARNLETITLVDTGRYGFERAILWAVTVR